ncbi:MAG: TetR/AcrR family transcriptional regulator, partial [Ilumatobacteraceae bacterium]
AESRPDQTPDAIASLLGELLPPSVRPASSMLAASWRCALLAVADGVPPAAAKAGMRWVLNVQSAA